MNDRNRGSPVRKVSLRLLGGVGVDAPSHAEAEQLPARPKGLALLAWLATALPRGPWRRDALLPVFWPALDEDRARSALRQTVFQLRKVLPAGALPALGTQEVRVDFSLVGSDVGDFEELLDGGREEEALALYHGDLLSGFHLSGCPEFERWLDRERERLRRRASRAAWFLAEHREQGGVDADPAPRVRQAIGLAPFDETGIRRGMQMLVAAGNLGAAIEVFEAYRRDLERDHGVQPASETLALLAKLRGHGVQAPPPGPARPGSPDGVPASVAVLPFTDLGPAGDLEWFGAGLAEEIIDRLVQAGGVQVCARTSSFAALGEPDDAPVDVRALGRRLGVDAILEGSVRADGERFRVTAQLIRVEDGFHMWSTRFDPTSSDLFTVQDEIAVGVTRRLLGEDLPATNVGAVAADGVAPTAAAPALSPRPAIPADAYHEYLRGRYQLLRRTPASLERAVTHLERAIAEAPGFGPAHAALAECFAILPVYTSFPSAHAMPLARAAADRALGLDDSLSEALGARAYAGLVYDWDWAGAERSWSRAVELDPGAARLRATYALYPLSCTGRHAQAIEEVERARADDPLSLPVIAYAGYVHLFARDYAAAAERAREAVEQDDEFVLGHWVLGSTLQCMGNHQAALAEYARAVELTRGSSLMRLQLACGLAGADDRAGAEQILEDVGDVATASPYFRAMVLTRLGRTDEAMADLRRAYRERAVHLVFLNVEPRLDALRDDPRFRELVLRIGLRPSASASSATGPDGATTTKASA